jgi:hypothetical protein
MTTRCRADVHQAQAHTCADPAGCGVDQMISGVDPIDAELERLHVVLDGIEDLTHGRKTLRSDDVLALIHAERGGPR